MLVQVAAEAQVAVAVAVSVTEAVDTTPAAVVVVVTVTVVVTVLQVFATESRQVSAATVTVGTVVTISLFDTHVVAVRSVLSANAGVLSEFVKVAKLKDLTRAAPD